MVVGGGDIEGQGIFGGERDFHIKVKQCLVEPLHFDQAPDTADKI